MSGLQRDAGGVRGRRAWTKQEDEVIKARYPDEATKAIAEEIGRSERATYMRAAYLGVRKSSRYFLTHAAGRLTGENLGKRFQKGQTPWNAGLKGSTGLHPNSKKTHFKKGQLSGTAAALLQPLGATRINKGGQLERKVSEGGPYPAARWKPISRLVWEAANGPVPSGHLVVFKPGMATAVEQEISLDRLELVSRAENMRRNSYHTRYPEIAGLIQLRGALNRQINKRKDQ